MRKLLISLIGLSFLIPGVFNMSNAEEKYPTKPVEVVGLYLAGGGADLPARALCEAVIKYFGQPWVIVPKPGAGGMVATGYLARAKPDGYTIANQIGTGQVVTNFFLQDLNFKQDDIEPVIQWTSFDLVVVIRADSPWKTMTDVVEYARKNPGSIKYATYGKGTHPHFQMEIMARQLGIKLTPVFYKGTAEVLPALLDGIVPMVGGATIQSVKDLARDKKVRILFTFSPQGLEEFPEIPTFKKALGVEQRLFPSYMGVFVPKGTPADRKQFIHDCVKKVLEDPEFKNAMKQMNFPIVYNNAEAIKKRTQEETKIIGELIKEFGMGK